MISSLADSEMLWRVTDWPVTIARRLARHLIPIWGGSHNGAATASAVGIRTLSPYVYTWDGRAVAEGINKMASPTNEVLQRKLRGGS